MKILSLLALLGLVVFGCEQDKKLKEPIEVSTSAPEMPAQTDVLAELPTTTSLGCSSELAQRTVYFDFDKFHIRNDALANLEEIINCMRDNNTMTIKAVGHCDERGTEEYNLALGSNRAEAVKDYLRNQGVADDRITTTSRGELEPAVEGQGESAWALNRRVEFILVSE
ncbi:MAG: OmpA family protein [Pseudomonadota bacterium]|nr:OmpA family protein [Pseudomonadota bacterium]